MQTVTEHKIIHIPNQYLLVIDESLNKREGYCYQSDLKQVVYYNGNYGEERPKEISFIIAHLPLCDSSVLSNIDLLPEISCKLSDDDIYKLAEKQYKGKEMYATYDAHISGFITGFKSANNKHSEEDLKRAFDYGMNAEAGNIKRDYKKYPSAFEQFMQSLSNNKTPSSIKVITTIKEDGTKSYLVDFTEKGSVWKGEYIYG